MNATPLADVSLSLLLGFLVITPIILQTLATQLPQAGGVASGQVRQDPRVVLTAESEILINDEKVSEEELPARLKELFPPEADVEHRVVFTGSGEVPYRDVIDVLDLLKENGVETIGIR
ncbi:MAG: biopolymer transporter ExbD [Gemmatimonadetes bacterium]|nr:biopolymer transporter ExbD [Gemmatimonadota bacterium]